MFLKKNKKETKETIFDKDNLDLIKILLELEKELRDRTDISSTFFGMIFAGGAYLLLSSTEHRKELLRIFVIIIPIIISHKLIVIHSIIVRIKEIQKKFEMNEINEIWSFIKAMCFPLAFYVVLFTFLLEITKS